ncbi:hypothetical protein [Sphingobacterium sp. E70]|uniref:hypothetical protein n=1 Tax=Sphingobacterium sp. E70 TaxID=2853439 RepID=UPI002795FB13|nr:hypothetical protein [Sphingobacterium sp. E70]
MMQAVEDLPMNFGFFGKGNVGTEQPIVEQIEAGALGLKFTKTGEQRPQQLIEH